jgi:hypothetical protein
MSKKVTPVTLLNPRAYSKDQQMMLDRWRVCRTCDRLDSLFRCRECGCFMKAKVKLSNSECPVGKWGRQGDSDGV